MSYGIDFDAMDLCQDVLKFLQEAAITDVIEPNTFLAVNTQEFLNIIQRVKQKLEYYEKHQYDQ